MTLPTVSQMAREFKAFVRAKKVKTPEHLLRIVLICRETGKEHMVKVHSGEGLANHSGPEPCGGLREETDEKSVGGHVGEVLRRETC